MHGAAEVISFIRNVNQTVATFSYCSATYLESSNGFLQMQTIRSFFFDELENFCERRLTRDLGVWTTLPLDLGIVSLMVFFLAVLASSAACFFADATLTLKE